MLVCFPLVRSRLGIFWTPGRSSYSLAPAPYQHIVL